MAQTAKCFSLHFKGERGTDSFLKEPFEQCLTTHSAQVCTGGRESDGLEIFWAECLRNGILMKKSIRENLL